MSKLADNRPQEIGAVELSKAYEYLDELRQSGETNMFGASPCGQRMFLLDYEDAKAVLKAWMQDFNKDE